ncbi:hypothetical protein PROPHIGD43A-4_51 [Mycobacterium phage prophiGD43A-4]|nr:hypothetical protein PROPHIGD43A-4_51 [Mycobacterium phage prophiGD43A-4]
MRYHRMWWWWIHHVVLCVRFVCRGIRVIRSVTFVVHSNPQRN